MYGLQPIMYENGCRLSIHTLFVHFIKISDLVKEVVVIWSIFVTKNKMKDVLLISKGSELVRVPLHNLVFIQASANYSELVTVNGKRTLVSFQLGQIEDLIEEQLGEDKGDFLRIGRGLIINSTYIFHIDVTRQKLVLSDGDRCWFELNASKEVLGKLKTWIEIDNNA